MIIRCFQRSCNQNFQKQRDKNADVSFFQKLFQISQFKDYFDDSEGFEGVSGSGSYEYHGRTRFDDRDDQDNNYDDGEE